ncbi:MAG: 23S rRNA (adenine(1618)-N(6))-methyltransferase RlmF [Lentimicrobiaceae bacterium]|nr:23S rRNA (adenine(1618)-N(6))-methyltransferase RlmF [Lentimicrobiaceae bacterium]
MSAPKKVHPVVKDRLHPLNKHRARYDFKVLTEALPELASFVTMNVYNDESVDFSNPEAVKALNKALLKYYYGINYWDIPEGYLCPPIPGRADYIHHIAGFLRSKNYGKLPSGSHFVCFDIGVGANCVYPLIGHQEYGWSFIGSDIDAVAIESAQKIVDMNPGLSENISIRLQPDSREKFFRIIQKDELVDLTVCNPPFHASMAEAQAGSIRKVTNLKLTKSGEALLNFGGRHHELLCEGGESRFIGDMIKQSRQFAESCLWFSTLVSKQSNLKGVYGALGKIGAVEIKTIPMGQGNKSSRMVAWTLQSAAQQKKWMDLRWNSNHHVNTSDH